MTGFALNYERRAGRLAAIAALVGGLIGLLAGLVFADGSRRALFDTWQRAAPREISSDHVAVVMIDNASIKTVGPWPWPRYYMARLSEEIARGQPKVIAFDMLFPSGDAFSPRIFASLYPEFSSAAVSRLENLPDMDEAFAQVVGSAPVLLPRLAVDHDGIDPGGVMLDPEIAGRPPPGALSASQVMTSIPTLDDVALAHAVVNGPPDDDGTVRRVPLTVMAGGRAMPGLAVELARIMRDVDKLEWQGRDLALGDIALSADASASLPIRMGFFPENSIYRADEVLAGRISSAVWRDKIVLIGLGADGTADIVPTPISNSQIGVLVQAQAVDALLEGGWLERPQWAWGAELAMALMLIALVLTTGLLRRSWPMILALATASTLPLVSFLAFDRANLLLDPVWPTLAGLAAALAMWGALYLLARNERTRLAAALVEQRVAVAAQEGELRVARRIQLGMVPGAERLASLSDKVDIGAVLHPARSVGGDFYDAALIAPGKLLVVIGDVTGKGVPAALFMALSKALTKSVLGRGEGDLGVAMSELNRDLMEEADDEMGVTMLVGVLDCGSGDIAMVNAGHENPLLIHGENDVEVISMRGGPPLCVIDLPYQTEHARLAPGETVMFITDGATEAQNASLELFGLDGVLATLAAQGKLNARARVEGLADRVRAFEGETEPSDDLTILALRYLGS